MLGVPSQGPSRLNSPVTNGPLLPLVGSAQVLPRVLVSQKIESSVRLSPVLTVGVTPTLSESVGELDPIGFGPWLSVL